MKREHLKDFGGVAVEAVLVIVLIGLIAIPQVRELGARVEEFPCAIGGAQQIALMTPAYPYQPNPEDYGLLKGAFGVQVCCVTTPGASHPITNDTCATGLLTNFGQTDEYLIPDTIF